MKKISVMIPCWNEEENIWQITNEVKKVILSELSSYDYEIVIIDNKSTDNSRQIIRQLCSEDKKIKGIFKALQG